VRLTIALAALSLSACVLDPFSGTALPPAATEVTFRGLAAYQPGVRMRVLLQEESGALTPLGEASVATSGAWTATVAVPDRAWARPPCGAARFVFRGSNGTTAYGQDAACIAAAGPGATAEQRLACLVPAVELFRGRVHAGDLTITGQAEADANACVTVVDGNLTLDGGRVRAPPAYASGLAFAMPHLEEVRGNLSVDGGRTATFSLPRLQRVGGDLAMLSTEFAAVAGTRASQGLTTFSLPALAAVGGSVDLRNAREMLVMDFQVHDFGLDALASVGADVRIHQEVFAGRILGLRALTRIPRDLVFEGGRTDVDNDALLPALTSVGRDVTLVVSRNARRFGTALVAVGRNVAIAPEALSSSFEPRRDEFLPVLQNVGGDLVLTALSLPCGTSALPSLRSVGGALRVTGQVPEASLGSTGASPLVLGGFSMTTTSGRFVPLPADASVSGKGPVSFTGNGDLCACQVEAFAAGLTARGWAGTLTNTGNAGGAACKPCPAPTCP